MTQTPPNKPVARGLGRGLDVLLGPRPSAPRPADAPAAVPVAYPQAFQCAIDKISPMPGQPRRHFDGDRLDELANSLREHGLLEPLVVRRRPGTDVLELIAGERRWRAAQRAGFKEILVVVRDTDPKQAFELALIENVQREDLDPIEFAEALERLIRDYSYTQETVAERVGKERSTVANALRLLKLPAKVREQVISRELSEGHARALLGAPDEKTMNSLAEKVLRGHLSVRQTEQLVRSAKAVAGGKAVTSPNAPPHKSASVRDLESRLTRHLGTRVEVKDKQGKGEIVIQYGSLDELDRLLETLL